MSWTVGTPSAAVATNKVSVNNRNLPQTCLVIECVMLMQNYSKCTFTSFFLPFLFRLRVRCLIIRHFAGSYVGLGTCSFTGGLSYRFTYRNYFHELDNLTADVCRSCEKLPKKGFLATSGYLAKSKLVVDYAPLTQ